MTRLLPGLAAFVAAMLVALLGLYAQAGAPEPREAPPPGVVTESRGVVKESREGVVKLRLLGVNDYSTATWSRRVRGSGERPG